jgi:hypothetical protein
MPTIDGAIAYQFSVRNVRKPHSLTKKSVLCRPSAVGSPVTGTIYHMMQMAAARLDADAVIVQGSQPQSHRDYRQYPKLKRL